ncbi:MAG: tyrosine-protein phosphatase, partial [Anaerolineaceae bacterium]|nr:tyrosine-protein phosphatase [Anaerolineaceae bacterium]
MALLSLPAFIFVLIFVCSLAYLSWQANIDIPEKDTLFKVKTDDPIVATRNSITKITINWDTSITPSAIAVTPNPQDEHFSAANLPAGSTSVSLTGVPPLPRPYFTVQQNGHTPINIAERILPFEGINNFRDLGGYCAADGRVLKWGQLFRSGHLGTPSQFDHDLLQNLGIKTIIDLRSPQERRKMPDTPFRGVTNLHIPLFRSDPFMYRHIIFQRHKLGQRLEHIYTSWVIDGSAKELGHILHIVSNPENLPLLFHCTAGKDRTGITAAI